jgi:hypothetical protein
MAMVTEDGDVVYFDVTQGFEPPPMPEEVQAERARRAARQVSRNVRERDLEQNLHEIVDGAVDKRELKAIARVVHEEVKKTYLV